MGKDSLYYKSKHEKDRKTLDRLKSALPEPAKQMVMFKAEQGIALSTQISYCYDLSVFFRYYLMRADSSVSSVDEIDYQVLNDIPKQTFLDYKSYLEYNDIGEFHRETGKGIARKFASLRNLYRYHIAMGNIEKNPVAMIFIKRESRQDHTIIRLTLEEVEKLLKAVQKQTIFKRGRQRTYKKMTKQRDMAMFVLLLNTGLRISELVGLDITDVDLKENSVTVVRKGGFADKIFFNAAIKDILKTYIKGERKQILESKVSKGSMHREAFFLSVQGKRWTMDSIERTVRQYTQRVIPYKHITPHKLRATYGSILYSQTGDIRLVSEVLGHENINTTIKYYAAMDDGRKKDAAKAVCLLVDGGRKKGKYVNTSSSSKNEGEQEDERKEDVVKSDTNIISFAEKVSMK